MHRYNFANVSSKNKSRQLWLLLFIIAVLSFVALNLKPVEAADSTIKLLAASTKKVSNSTAGKFSLAKVPAYSGTPYAVINKNVPYFTKADRTSRSYERYSPLDNLGRCGVAVANIGRDLMPTAKRGKIGQVKPSGWHLAKYDCVEGKYLYNRCHLIGYQLTAENANERNLITGTRYLNVQGMLPFENMVADYIKETGNHVLYRVTPIFQGNNLVAHGVLMEAMSVEDNGQGILFNIFCYNVQPQISIDYKTGASSYGAAGTAYQQKNSGRSNSSQTSYQKKYNKNSQYSKSTAINIYVLNNRSKKIHLPSCSYAQKISPSNREEYTGSLSSLIRQGYSPCKNCNP
ncbi:MAG: DNA/RNA non-specific endonuclease [Candidatus Bruticola sp.]